MTETNGSTNKNKVRQRVNAAVILGSLQKAAQRGT
jgi:hypothetical protein